MKLPHPEDCARLEARARALREDVIRMLTKAGSGHSAGPLGMADVFACLYFWIIRHRPADPKWAARDRVILSNGHICPIWYTALGHAGYFPREQLQTLRMFGSGLQGHPHRGTLPGVENTSGPLGQGISQACGIALAGLMKAQAWRVYCLMSDGECNEGQVWEAFLFAAAKKLSNLTIVIDRNQIQIDGYTEEVMPLEPLTDKLASFGLHVIAIDGHDPAQICDACHQATYVTDKPTVILARTVPGKGVHFMEGDYNWHGKPPTEKEALRALNDLRTLRGAIHSEHE